MAKIKIIGCGVIGLSTGICLNLAGEDTEIITEKIPMESDNYKDKEGIATEYATASVKPSTIPNKNLKSLLQDSIQIFDKLSEETDIVDFVPHFMGGNQFKHPEYREVVHNYKKKDESEYEFPFTTDSGGVFDVHYVQMDKYIKYLIGLYEETGGLIRKSKISDISDINIPTYLYNCSGYGSRELFEDNSMKAIRGHLAYVETGERLNHDSYGGAFSYSFTFDNRKVYCYPHRNMIILGKSAIHDSPEWESYENYYEPEEGEKLPRHIISKNRTIIEEVTGIDITNYNIFGTSGYRPYREKGIRIEKDGSIIHNYGHGGSGVTFSWGSAIKATNQITDFNTEKITSKLEEHESLF